jgi:putative CocE/NonD family hydrolase
MAWGSETAVFYTDSIEGPFFDYYLKGEGALTLPEAFVFNTGANVWRRLDAWPPPRTTTSKIVLGSGGRLTIDGNDGSDGSEGREYDEYIHDPSRPVPYSNRIGRWYDPGFMVEDQRFAARRPDVLVYETEPLAEDVTLAGPIDVRFTVSTSGTDADWIVKVIDVFPDTAGRAGPGADWFQGPGAVQLGGYQMLVRGDVLRGKFRNSLEKPEPFVPDQATPIGFRLNDVFHTFKRGHRIMVQVQSSWFPMVDRNPGVFLDIFQAKDADFRETTQRLYHSTAHPSWIEARVLR